MLEREEDEEGEGAVCWRLGRPALGCFFWGFLTGARRLRPAAVTPASLVRAVVLVLVGAFLVLAVAVAEAACLLEARVVGAIVECCVSESVGSGMDLKDSDGGSCQSLRSKAMYMWSRNAETDVQVRITKRKGMESLVEEEWEALSMARGPRST